jgi:hypothetical protein
VAAAYCLRRLHRRRLHGCELGHTEHRSSGGLGADTFCHKAYCICVLIDRVSISADRPGISARFSLLRWQISIECSQIRMVFPKKQMPRLIFCCEQIGFFRCLYSHELHVLTMLFIISGTHISLLLDALSLTCRSLFIWLAFHSFKTI